MKKIILSLAIIFVASNLSSCNETENTNNGNISQTTSTGVVPTEQLAAGEIESSDVSRVKPVLSTSYKYLDSEKVSYENGTLGDIIKPYKYTVVYFYPKDGTPNCTIQALDFSAKKSEFASYGVQIIGVSKDDLDSHKKFAERNELTIKLLQDTNSELLEQFGALGTLQEYGNGTEKSDILRSTFIIDSTGKPIRAFTDVQAMGHADRVLAVIRELQ